MIKQRMIEVARYLNKERMASYKEIAQNLGENERAIRYDIDQINDELKLRKSTLIEKYPKGMIFIPDQLNLSAVLENSEFVFSPQERVSIIQLYALFDIERLNIRAFCNELQVSRRSIQNDISIIQKELKKDNIILSYDKGFKLKELKENSFEVRSRVIQKNIPILYKKRQISSYNIYIYNLIERVLEPISLSGVLGWVDSIIDTMKWTLSDETFHWYVANVITFSWYLRSGKELPQTTWRKDSEIANHILKFEELIGKTLNEKEIGILSEFSKYTNRYENLDVKQDLMSVEDIAILLVKSMGKELHIDFYKDGILMKGLLNHIGPLLERVRDNRQLQEDSSDFIPDEYKYVYNALSSILQKHEELYILTDNETEYLVMYFLGSIRRMQQEQYKSVLLICGYGYGTTALVKDTLINEYQVFVRKNISAYQLYKFNEWDDIDVVISTVNVDLPVERPFAKVNVVFKKEDYIKLDLLGLRKKNILTNYFAIERKLDFLSDDDRKKVLDVIREEFGYKEVRMPQKYYKLSDLLEKEDILCVDYIDDWRSAVKICTGILEEKGKITSLYQDNIIKGMEVQGFYSVTDGVFALLHGSENIGVEKSCMSLLISSEPIHFGDKQVNIVFCLASRDKKEHIPAIIRLMRMVSMTKFINLLEMCKNSELANKVIETCEKEVETCYQ